MSRRDWSSTERVCPTCGRKLTLTATGRFPMHYRTSPGSI